MAFNIRVFAIAAILLSATFGPAQSSRFTSAYSTLDLDLCTIRSRDRQAGGATWSCPPHNGIEIWVAEGDLRFFVSFGKKARKQPAASQTLPPWNRLNDTLEWRIGPDGRPVATILRWFTEFDGRADGQVLVVTRLPDATSKAVCHGRARRYRKRLRIYQPAQFHRHEQSYPNPTQYR